MSRPRISPSPRIGGAEKCEFPVRHYNIWGAQAKPDEPCPVTALVASGQKAGSVCSVSNGIDEAWRYLYGTHETDVIRQVTRINRPAVNGVSNNIAFILDDARTRVVERIDSLNVNEFLKKTSRTSFKSTANRTRIAETALPVETLRPSEAKTTIAYTDDGAGNPEKITETTKPLTGAPLTRETISTFGTVTGQTNLTPRASVKRPGVTTTTRYSDFKPAASPRPSSIRWNRPPCVTTTPSANSTRPPMPAASAPP